MTFQVLVTPDNTAVSVEPNVTPVKVTTTMVVATGPRGDVTPEAIAARDAAETAQAAAASSAGAAAASEAAAETARDEAQAVAPTLSASIGTVAVVLGQAYEEIERLRDGQEDAFDQLSADLIADVAPAQIVPELASLIGALSDQINGGQVTLRGGTLADPALRIGTAGIYSSASDTLSIAIAGSEVVRFTASGVTIYGTVTEAP